MAVNRTDELLEEILKWTRASAFKSVAEVLGGVLSTPKLRLVYQLTDGTRGRDQVRLIAEVGSQTVDKLWDQCISMGLMETREANKRKRAFDLRDFGMITDEEISNAVAAASLVAKPPKKAKDV